MSNLFITGKLNFLMLLLILAAPPLTAETDREVHSKTYTLKYIQNPAIDIDGFNREKNWRNAEEDTRFSWPWIDAPSPATRFRAFYSDDFVFFYFDTDDSDLVISPDSGEGAVARGDRVELFFSTDPEMKDYYCLEIDPTGRVLDYKASFYRDFDRIWNLEGLRTAGRITNTGYAVEAAIPLDWFRQTSISNMEPGSSLIAGIYRGEFSYSKTGEINQSWISWQNPQTKKPDFHVPSSLGIFIPGGN